MSTATVPTLSSQPSRNLYNHDLSVVFCQFNGKSINTFIDEAIGEKLLHLK